MSPAPGRPKAGSAPSGGSAAAQAASVGASSMSPAPGRPKAGSAPSGGSAAAQAASVGAA